MSSSSCVSSEQFANASCKYMLTTMSDSTKQKSFAELAVASLEEQAQYADSIVRQYATDPQFIQDQSKTLQEVVSHISQMNQCSLGNMAYMALHNQDQNYKDILFYIRCIFLTNQYCKKFFHIPAEMDSAQQEEIIGKELEKMTEDKTQEYKNGFPLSEDELKRWISL